MLFDSIIIDFLFFGIAFQGFFLAALLYYKLKDWKVAAYYLVFSVVLITWVLFWLGEKGLIGSVWSNNSPDFSILLGPLLLASMDMKKVKKLTHIAFIVFGVYLISGLLITDFFQKTGNYVGVVSIFLNSVFLVFASKGIGSLGSRLMSYALMAFIVYMVVFWLLSYLGFLTWIVDYGTALIISFFFYVSGHQYLIKSKFRTRTQKQTPEHNIILERTLLYLKKSQKYLDSDYRIIDLARDLNISDAQLSEVIRCSEYDNFKSLINHFRVDHSKKLLRNSDLKVLAVAMESGFNNKVSFNNNFKKYTGTSPALYREKIKR